MLGDATPETEGFRAFATRLGVKPGYVTQLRHAGRLVLSEDGKSVRVADSIRLIEETRDPSKQGVRDRHAETRAAVPAAAADADLEDHGADDDADPDDALPEVANREPPSPHNLRRAKALADKEEALARRALREEQVEMGQLFRKDDIIAAIENAAVQLRQRLELLPSTLSPALAAMEDEDQVRVKLRDEIEKAMGELEKAFGKVARAAG